MEALALVAALMTADTTVRESEAFALAGELGRFPPPAVVANHSRMAKEHLEYLEHVREAGPLAGVIDDDHLERQKFVVRAHGHVQQARCYLADLYQYGEYADEYMDTSDSGRLGNVQAEIASLKHLLGESDYVFGRLPAPLPCMER